MTVPRVVPIDLAGDQADAEGLKACPRKQIASRMRRKETAMIELTQEQRRELDAPGPAQARDPLTNETYVLVRADVYERLKGLLQGDTFAADAYPQVMEVFGRDGWNDPSMDIYDDLDPRRS
jgi:hypothetical protein